MSDDVTLPRAELLDMMRDQSRGTAVSMVDQVLDAVLEVLTIAAKERASMWEFIAHFPELQREMVHGIESNFDAKWDDVVRTERLKAGATVSKDSA